MARRTTLTTRGDAGGARRVSEERERQRETEVD